MLDGSSTVSPGAGAGGQQKIADLLVPLKLQEIEPGWSDARLKDWLEREFFELLSQGDKLPEEPLLRYLDQLVDRLEATGYEPGTVKKYQTDFLEPLTE